MTKKKGLYVTELSGHCKSGTGTTGTEEAQQNYKLLENERKQRQSDRDVDGTEVFVWCFRGTGDLSTTISFQPRQANN